MKKGICYIVGAGENDGILFMPSSDDYVIAADGGFHFLRQKGITVDLVIGDFDSSPSVPQHPNVIVLNKEKDDTDMRAAVYEGIRAGYEKFHIFGGTGGRIDHTVANMQLLAELSGKGMQGFLFSRDTVITAIMNGAMRFPGNSAGYVSVFAHSEKAEGVFLKGLKYKLENAVLTNTYPLGVSNEFIGEESSISVKCGTLMIVFSTGVQCAYSQSNRSMI